MLELDAAEARTCALALESFLQLHALNGRGLTADDPRRVLAAKLALAAPIAALSFCPALLRSAGPDVTAQVRELAVTEVARQASQAAALRETAAPLLVTAASGSVTGPLSTPEVARLVGLNSHAVRAAIRRGRLAADKDESGEWRITRQAVDEWRARRAA
jgi:excisionase family DNA binding protein